MASSTLVKCNSMIISFVMPYLNVLLCFFGALLANTELLLILNMTTTTNQRTSTHCFHANKRLNISLLMVFKTVVMHYSTWR